MTTKQQSHWGVKMAEKLDVVYLEELEWRFNNRNNEFIFRDLLERILDSDALRYRELTASAHP